MCVLDSTYGVLASNVRIKCIFCYFDVLGSCFDGKSSCREFSHSIACSTRSAAAAVVMRRSENSAFDQAETSAAAIRLRYANNH